MPTTTKATPPRKKSAPRKRAPATSGNSTDKPAAAKADDATPTAKASTDECLKGGSHEWTEDEEGHYCGKCYEPYEDETAKGKQSKSDSKSGKSKSNNVARSKAGGETSSKAPKHKKRTSNGKTSAIDAAAKLLGETGKPMGAKELIDAMAEKGYWISPGGKTPHATLYAAILREIQTKGKDARFERVERGKFALAN